MTARDTVPEFKLRRRGEVWYGRFQAMASPCEVLVETDDKRLAKSLTRIAAREARRIEHKFSRYRDDNIVHRINASNGQWLDVDEESARLLDFADECYRLSDGRFDVTSGVLRRAWTFDGSDRLPEPAAVEALLGHVGWSAVDWQAPRVRLPAGMQLDFGGIGKEYAVDRIRQLLMAESDCPSLVNLGGDLAVSGPRAGARAWNAGVEQPGSGEAQRVIQLAGGALATSGDAHRFLLKDGVRYGHVLDPRTGWPVPDAPRSVTVAAATCIEAGMLATFALLRGADAEAFLRDQDVPHWILR